MIGELKPENPPGQLTVQADFEGDIKESRRHGGGDQDGPPGLARHDLVKKQEEQKRSDQEPEGGKEKGVQDQDPQGEEQFPPMNLRPDHFVFLVLFPLVEKSLNEVDRSQDSQKQAGKKGHESGLGGMKGSESKLEPPQANQEGQGDPKQIIDQEGLLHR
jgi:hypothetical protein